MLNTASGSNGRGFFYCKSEVLILVISNKCSYLQTLRLQVKIIRLEGRVDASSGCHRSWNVNAIGKWR